MARLHMTIRQRLALGAAALVAVGAAGGAGAVALTRPGVEMAPTVATPIARLANSNGIVTVKGRVAEVFGDRFVVQDGSGRAMIDAGRDGTAHVTRGNAVLVQGRYDEGQLRAHFLVGPSGEVNEVGPRPRPRGPGADAPPPPPPPPGAGPAGTPPPPPGVGPAGSPPPPPPGAGPAGTPPPPAVGPAGTPPPPPPVNGAAPPAPRAGAAPVAPAPAPTPAR
ncbi:hypothetical protein [Sphingomonas sp. CV7422]|uniref:hypothetical protein n=1 Tax=Sphingomonas sp. CV7422 TaxID=3018036 RepID=UPI0022FDE09F|nr:hypothetical protein [Sphingomonas sp. CV7422]